MQYLKVYLVIILLKTFYNVQAGIGLWITFEDHCCTSCFSLLKKYLHLAKRSPPIMTTTVTFKSLTYVFLPTCKRISSLNPH